MTVQFFLLCCLCAQYCVVRSSGPESLAETRQKHPTQLWKLKMEEKLNELLIHKKHTESEIDRMKRRMDAQEKELEYSKRTVKTQRKELAEQKLKLRKQNIKLDNQEKKLTEKLKREKCPCQQQHFNQQSDSFGQKDNQMSKSSTAPLVSLGLHRRSDDLGPLAPVVSQLTAKLNEVSAKLQAVDNVNVKQDQAIASAGTVYVRWGNTACSNSSDTVYSGYIGGSWYDHTGGPSNYLCLPPNPVFDGHAVPRYGSTELYGTECQTCDEPECDMSAVCSVCRVPRSSTIMIPGRDTCNAGWNLEYSGYLMGSSPGHHSNTEYICVDKQRGYVPATKGDENGALLHYTTIHCGSLSCPPYVEGSIVLCAVCSK